MFLKIKVDYTRIIDSPLDGAAPGKYSFSTTTSSLAQDILKGWPGAFLISGYRGSGKTSFVKQLEAEVDARDNGETVMFVYLNFAKFESHSILLRRLIREFYYRFDKNKGDNSIFQKLGAQKKYSTTLKLFKDIYDRTFYDITRHTVKRKSKSTIWTEEIKTNLRDLLLLVAALLCLGLTIPAWQLTIFSSTWWVKSIVALASAAMVIAKGFSFGKKFVKAKASEQETRRSSFYDNEIAEHHLKEILTMFHDENYKVVFVLDELDKLDEPTTITKLINELKPTMLSGLASFILVTGQKLYYDVHDSHNHDDHILSSLFSRSHHISLASPPELRNLAYSFITTDFEKINDREREVLDGFLDYLIFESKLIPRRLIGLVRQNIIWENEETHLSIDLPDEALKLCSTVMGIVQEIRDKEINVVGYPEPIRDYLNMQVLLYAHYLVGGGQPERLKVASHGIPKRLRQRAKHYRGVLQHAFQDAGLTQKGEVHQSPNVIENNVSIVSEPAPDAIINDFRDFQRILSDVYADLNDLKPHQLEGSKFSTLAQSLSDKGSIIIPGLHSQTLQAIFDNPKAFFEESELKNDALAEFKKHKLNFIGIIHQLLLHYVHALLESAFEKYVIQETDSARDKGIDLILKSVNLEHSDILVNVKFRRSPLPVLRDDLHGCIEALKKYDATTGKKNHVALILFSDQGTRGLEMVDFRYKRYAEELFGESGEQLTFLSIYIGNLKSLRAAILKMQGDLIGGYTTYPDIMLENQAPSRDQPELDDHYAVPIFDVTRHSYLIRLTPGELGPHWRIGLKFSGNNDFPSVTRRHEKNYPVVNLQANSDSSHVTVTYHNREGVAALSVATSIKSIGKQALYLQVVYNMNVVRVFFLDENLNKIIENPILLANAYLFKIFAWADGKSRFRWTLTIREDHLNIQEASIRTTRREFSNVFQVRLYGFNKYPLKKAAVSMILENSGTHKITDDSGTAVFEVASARTYTLIAAASGYRGVILLEVDITDDRIIEMREALSPAAGSTLFLENRGFIPGLEGELQISYGNGTNYTLTSSKIIINGKPKTSISFTLNETIVLADEHDTQTKIHFRYFDDGIALIDYEPLEKLNSRHGTISETSNTQPN